MLSREVSVKLWLKEKVIEDFDGEFYLFYIREDVVCVFFVFLGVIIFILLSLRIII